MGNSPVTGEFPAQMASNAANFSIWWRHHDMFMTTGTYLQHFDYCLSLSRSSLAPFLCITFMQNAMLWTPIASSERVCYIYCQPEKKVSSRFVFYGHWRRWCVMTMIKRNHNKCALVGSRSWLSGRVVCVSEPISTGMPYVWKVAEIGCQLLALDKTNTPRRGKILGFQLLYLHRLHSMFIGWLFCDSCRMIFFYICYMYYKLNIFIVFADELTLFLRQDINKYHTDIWRSSHWLNFLLAVIFLFLSYWHQRIPLGPGPLLITRIDFDPSMDKYLHHS